MVVLRAAAARHEHGDAWVYSNDLVTKAARGGQKLPRGTQDARSKPGRPVRVVCIHRRLRLLHAV
eukprot:6782570-Prymnesium_polylepis.1